MYREGYPQLNGRTKQEGSDFMMIHNGASEAAVANGGLFHAVIEVDGVEVELENSSTVISDHEGEVALDTGRTKVTLRTVFYISTLQCNLLSCSIVEEHGVTIIIADRRCHFMDRDC